MMAFNYSISKEQMKTNMILFSKKDLANMKPDVIIHKYLEMKIKIIKLFNFYICINDIISRSDLADF